MFKTYRVLFVLCLLISLSLLVSPVSSANSAEPPSILIIVPGAPGDLEISIGSQGEYSPANKTSKIFENYYTFYSRELKKSDVYTLKAATGGNSFEITMDGHLSGYNNIFTLDLKNQKLTPGKALPRSILLVSLRILLTLITEGLIFFLFGYRRKASWLAFLSINLITQGALNIWINGFAPLASYIIITLVFGEIMVLIAELAAFLALVREKGRFRLVLYVLTANLLSLVAGGYAITLLPI